MFTDIMIDTETTGLNPAYNGLMQLAGVKFNPETQEVSPDVFNEALALAPNRFWDESTREWWRKIPDVYQSIIERAREPQIVLKEFTTWVNKDGVPYRFWAKPTTFDWAFLDSYYQQFGMKIPFHYRTVRDMNSYIAGLHRSPEHVDIQVPFEGKEHDALWDCFHQIQVLFKAMELTK